MGNLKTENEMKKINLSDIILLSADTGLSMLGSDGSMPPGHNGPYHDPETPVRNTSHWMIIFLKAFEVSKDERFRVAAEKCLSYLMGPDARPMRRTFWHRSREGKDATNGVIGQAWTIEALVVAYQEFKRDDILALASEVFKLHPYNERLNGWKVVGLDGNIAGFDYTFNHQLWFAAIGTLIMSLTNETDLNGVKSFVRNLTNNLQTYSDGVIKHVPPFYLKSNFFQKLKTFASSIKSRSHLYSKSVGYHAFNLYALVMIDERMPSLNILKANKIKKAIDIVSTKKFETYLNQSKYGYPYNPVGIELAYVMQRLHREDEREFWLNEQISKTFDFRKKLMVKGNPFDVNTAATRIYEAVRLNDAVITVA